MRSSGTYVSGRYFQIILRKKRIILSGVEEKSAFFQSAAKMRVTLSGVEKKKRALRLKMSGGIYIVSQNSALLLHP